MIPVILSAVRLPTGRFQGALRGLAAPELGALVVREAVARAGVAPAAVDECIMGNVLSAGLGQNPARQAALGAGLAERDPTLAQRRIDIARGNAWDARFARIASLVEAALAAHT